MNQRYDVLGFGLVMLAMAAMVVTGIYGPSTTLKSIVYEYQTLIGAAAALYAGYLAFIAAKHQLELNRETLTSTQRAYLFCKQVHAAAGVKKSTAKVIDWSFFPVWENAGATPPRNLYMTSSWRVFTPKMPEGFDFTYVGPAPQRIMLGPKTTTWGGECVIPIETLIDANKGICEVYLYGWVEYDDVFAGTARHRTEYCLQVRVLGDPTLYENQGEPLVPFVYRAIARHNGSDEECEYPHHQSSNVR